MTVDREKLIEKMAHHLVRVLQDVLGMDIVISARDEFGFLLPEGHDVLTCTGPIPLGERDIARAILQSIEAQDLVIVPVEPTEEEIAQMDDDLQELMQHPPKPGELTSRQIVQRFYKTLLVSLIQSQKGGSDG